MSLVGAHRRIRAALAAVAALCACFGADAQMRTFTDTQGRTITAELVDSTVSTVRIRRDDGRTFEIEKSVLGPADLEFVAAWEQKRAFAYGGLEIAARRVRLESDRRQTKSSVKKEETWCWKVDLRNGSRATLEGLAVEWRVFYKDDTARADTAKLPLKRQQGRTPVGTLEPGATVEIQTSPLVLQSTELRPGRVYADTNKRKVEDSLEGVWIRLVRGREVLAEHAMPSDLPRRADW
jgi:hypothetical protein